LVRIGGEHGLLERGAGHGFHHGPEGQQEGRPVAGGQKQQGVHEYRIITAGTTDRGGLVRGTGLSAVAHQAGFQKRERYSRRVVPGL